MRPFIFPIILWEKQRSLFGIVSFQFFNNFCGQEKARWFGSVCLIVFVGKRVLADLVSGPFTLFKRIGREERAG